MGDCSFDVEERGLLFTKSMNMKNVYSIFVDYFRVGKDSRGSFSVDVPVTVLMATEPDTFDVALDSLHVLESGIELVFGPSSVTGSHSEYCLGTYAAAQEIAGGM